MSFVTNPLFQKPDVIEVDLANRSRDLAVVVELSGKLNEAQLDSGVYQNLTVASRQRRIKSQASKAPSGTSWTNRVPGAATGRNGLATRFPGRQDNVQLFRLPSRPAAKGEEPENLRHVHSSPRNQSPSSRL